MSELSEEETIDYLNLYTKITEKQIENGELFLVEDSEKKHLKAIKRIIRVVPKGKRKE